MLTVYHCGEVHLIDIPDGISSDQELGRIMLGISNALSIESIERRCRRVACVALNCILPVF